MSRTAGAGELAPAAGDGRRVDELPAGAGRIALLKKLSWRNTITAVPLPPTATAGRDASSPAETRPDRLEPARPRAAARARTR